MQIEIKYLNEVKTFSSGTTYYEIAKAFDFKDALAVQIKNEVESLDSKAMKSCEVIFLDVTSLTGYKIYQSALKFLFYVAVQEIFPDAEVDFLHSVPKGILSEIESIHNFTSEDVSKIKGKMAELVHENHRFIKYNLDIKEAYRYLLEKNETE